MYHLEHHDRRGALRTPLCVRLSIPEDQPAVAFGAGCVPNPRVLPEDTGMQNLVVPNRSAWLPDRPQMPDRRCCMRLAWRRPPRWNRITTGVVERSG